MCHLVASGGSGTPSLVNSHRRDTDGPPDEIRGLDQEFAIVGSFYIGNEEIVDVERLWFIKLFDCGHEIKAQVAEITKNADAMKLQKEKIRNEVERSMQQYRKDVEKFQKDYRKEIDQLKDFQKQRFDWSQVSI